MQDQGIAARSNESFQDLKTYSRGFKNPIIQLNIKTRWLMPAEVVVHNKPNDCWIVINNRVLDVSSVIKQNMKQCKCREDCRCAERSRLCGERGCAPCSCPAGPSDCADFCPCYCDRDCYCNPKQCAMILIAFAGKDVSHWFVKGTDEFAPYTHPIICNTFVKPVHGVMCHLGPHVATTRWRSVKDMWWADERRIVGRLTEKVRPIKILNTLTGSSVTLDVCPEESLYEIMMRYYPHNRHLGGYVFRYKGRALCSEATLELNGIPDDRERFDEQGLPENLHIPTIFVYFNDDLTDDHPECSPCFTGEDCGC